MRGGQHQVLLLLHTLREAGHVCALLARDGSPLWRAGIGAGFPVEAATASQVRKQSRRVDIVHAHDARAHTLAAIHSKRAFVVSRRVAFPIKRSLASRWKYWRAARYLAVSKFVATELHKAGISESNIDVVYDAVHIAARAEPWSPEFPAVALSTTDPRKGRDLVESAAKSSGVEVLFSDDLPRDLTRASIFVYLTRSEGLGSAVLLAMQMGVPVIASAVDGLLEIFKDGESGLYVKNDPQEVMRAMRKILGNRFLAQSLIQNAQQLVEERFTPQHLLANTLAAYQRALA